MLLNGEEALWYSRIRYLDSDFHRTQRQRKVITAIVEKASKMSLTNLYSLAEIKNVRKDENIGKGYISGKYGAIPMLNDTIALLIKDK